MTNFSQYFMQEFHDRLLRPNGNNPVRDRASGFKKIFELLDGGIGKTIIETGCIRPDHGEMCFGDDGCSTIIFDSFVSQCGGSFYSVDINPANVEFAKNHVNQSRSNIVCSDSVRWLRALADGWSFKTDGVSLLYLDSYDIVRDNPLPSQLHHLKELCAAMPLLRPGSIVAVDDADAFFDGGQTGKATFVRNFMDNIGAKKIHDGYQLVYQM